MICSPDTAPYPDRQCCWQNLKTHKQKDSRIALKQRKKFTWLNWFKYFSSLCREFSGQNVQGDSVARGPKLLSIKNYVIEIMTWKWKMKTKKRCKTGPAHNRWWNWSPFTSKHTWKRFSKFWNTFSQSVDVDCLNLLAYSVFELFDCAGCIFVHFALQ